MLHDTSMRTLFRWIRSWRATSQTLVEVLLSRAALLSNYEAFRTAYNLPVAPVLKSNAYGHGLLQVARILSSDAPLLVVDSYHEACLLRQDGIRTPILVIGFVPIKIINLNKLAGVSFVITSIEGLEAVVASGSRARVHIKLDTGMHRQGLLPQQTTQAIGLIKNSQLEVEGICSHFASADSDPHFTRKQIALWNASVEVWRKEFQSMRYWHIAASAGAAFSAECDANLIRLGAGLYGFERIASRDMPLSPVLSMRSQLVVVKDISKGESVGYNTTFTAEKDMRIATVPVGYFEGFDRRLSNKGSMLVEGVVCPVIGRVSMNMSILDVTECVEARFGTKVVVISDKVDDPNSIENLSQQACMSPLEFLVHIPQHLRRVVV